MLYYYICPVCSGFTVSGDEIDCCSYCHSPNIIALSNDELLDIIKETDDLSISHLAKEKLWYGKMTNEQKNFFIKKLQDKYVKYGARFDKNKENIFKTKDKKYKNIASANKSAQERREREHAEREATRPRCPTCHSTDIKRITIDQKIGGFLLLGVFSQKAKRQFHCNHCGYEW